MLFNSYLFMFVFLPSAMLGYHWLSARGRPATTAWLILCSLVFYGWWDVRFLPLLLASILVNYAVGRRIAGNRSKVDLAMGLAFNLGILCYFKYAGLFTQTLSQLTGMDSLVVQVILPLGISFFTFQKIAYLVDCYRGLTRPYDLAEFSLFVLFFPQLIAGPIIHHGEFVPQYLARDARLRAEDVAVGLTLFIIGLFKKTVLAESMATYASPMFDAAAAGQAITFLEAWSGAIAYSLQLYFDFSAYSDMAIGLARLFGMRFPVNFDSPYKATSIIDFWRRWHVTLSRFLKLYLYVPLGGNRKGPARRYINLLIVMLLGGFWHGANWTFLAWGGLHGVYLAANHAWVAVRRKYGLRAPGPPAIWKVLAWGLTYLSVVVAWVFFRAADFPAAFNILSGMVAVEGRFVVTPAIAWALSFLPTVFDHMLISEKPLAFYEGARQVGLTLLVLAVALLAPNSQEWLRQYRPTLEATPECGGLARHVAWAPTPLWAIVVMALAVAGLLGTMRPTEFIYWQF